jgi:hypothetical protein
LDGLPEETVAFGEEERVERLGGGGGEGCEVA